MAKFEMTEDGLYYCYENVADIIDSHYACSERIDAYLGDEVFQDVVINSYARINLSNDKDCSRVLAKMSRIGYWLKRRIKLYEAKEKKNGTD